MENTSVAGPSSKSKGKQRATSADFDEWLSVDHVDAEDGDVNQPIDPDDDVWVEVFPSGDVQIKGPARAATGNQHPAREESAPRRTTYSAWPQVNHSRTFKLTAGQAEVLRSRRTHGMLPEEVVEWYLQQGIEPPLAEPAPAHLRLASGPVTAENVNDSPYVDGYPYNSRSNAEAGPSTAPTSAWQATTPVRLLEPEAAPVFGVDSESAV